MARMLTAETVPGLRCPMCRSRNYTIMVSRGKVQLRARLGGRAAKASQEIYHFCCAGSCRIVHPIADTAVPKIFAQANRIKAERAAREAAPAMVARRIA